MSALRPYEIEAIRLLAGDILSEELLLLLEKQPEASSYEYTGCGYFLTLAHPALPAQGMTLGKPIVMGTCGQIFCGFVVLLGDHELTLECHSWGGADEVPSDIRNHSILISMA